MDVAKLATPPVDAVKAAFDELYKAAAIDPAANTALGKIIALLGPQLGEPVGEGVAATARKFRTGSGEVTLSAREMDMCRGMKIAPAEYAKDKAQRTSAKKAGGR